MPVSPHQCLVLVPEEVSEPRLPAQGFGDAPSARGSQTQSSPGGQCPMRSRALVPLFSASRPTAHYSPSPRQPAARLGLSPDLLSSLLSSPLASLGPKSKVLQEYFPSSQCRRPWTQEPRHHLERILCSGRDACPAPSHLQSRDTPSAPPGHPLPFSEGLADPCSLCWCLLFLLPVLNCVSSHLWCSGDTGCFS